MRLAARLLRVSALVMVPIAGCTQVTEEPPPTTAPMTLFVYEFPEPVVEDRVPLEGVQLCETETSNCALSDDRGIVTIELPRGEEYSYTLEKDGYASHHVADIVSDAPDGYNYQHGIASDERLAQWHQSVPSPYPMRGTGTITIWVGFAGATFELVGATGTPFYSDEDEEEEYSWRSDLTETTSIGWGGFTEVTPGEFKIRVGGSAQDCVTDQSIGFALGWPSDEPNTIRVPVLEGYINYTWVACAKAP